VSEEESQAEGTDAEQQQSLPPDEQPRAPLRHQSTIKSTASTTSSANRAEIPVITISKTESQDRLLEAGVQKAEPQHPTSPSAIAAEAAPPQPADSTE
jgi:hypothetical protein